MNISIHELKEKIKTIESWDWYFDPEIKDYKGFLEIFQEKYPNIEVDPAIIKKLGIALINGKDTVNISQNLIAEAQGQNVAFKCTWNDKGFAGICSRRIYEHNKEAGRIWCSQVDNHCQDITEEAFNKGEFPCYESHALIDYSFGSGIFHKGSKKDQAIALKNVRDGKLALLTTREPGMNEEDRYIFAILDIEKIKDERFEEKQIEPVEVYGNKETSLKVDKRVKLRFWGFYENIGNPDNIQWSTGLFRYITDITVFNILNKLRDEYIKLGNVKQELKKVENLIRRYEKWV